jgi:flagellin FlaB
MKKEAAFSGLEAAIVLIAFVVVAAVFSYVMLGAGFFSTQKAQEVTYSGMKQTTSNLVLDGYLFADSSQFTSITFYVKVPEGGESINLAEVDILYGKGTAVPSKVTPTTGGSGLLAPGDRTKIVLTASSPGPGSKFTIEIKPAIGASSLIVRTLSDGYTGGVIY